MSYNTEVKTFGDNHRALNKFVMDNTMELCETDENLINAIKDSINNQEVIYQEDIIDVIKDGPSTNIKVLKQRSFEAASYYKDKKVAVLNFANNHHIGGSPWSAGAQEESLCRCSTLYTCIYACKESFYDKHTKMYEKGEIDRLGNDDLIYTPNVIIIKSDESIPLILDNKDRYNVDIITCAAPENFNSFSEQTLRKVLTSRITKIIQVAKKHQVDVLILGAFGCGAFGNPPKLVAEVFNEVLNDYHFNDVVFALSGHEKGTENIDAFREVFE